MEEPDKLLAINAGRQRHQAVAAARNACRIHFPHVPMCVVNLDKTSNAVVFRVLCPDIKVLHVSQDSPDDTRAEVSIGLFTALLQGNSAIGTAPPPPRAARAVVKGLGGLLSGNTVSDANYAASFGFIGQLPPEVIQSATALSKAEYGGKTFPIIAEAYQSGMKPMLPIWQRIIILGSVWHPQRDVPSQVKSGSTPHALNLYKFLT